MPKSSNDMSALSVSTKDRPRRWRPQEIVYLKRHYAHEGIPAVASSLKRSIRAVNFRLTRLNLHGRKITSWTGEEDAYLRRWYGRRRFRVIGRKLKRSWQSVTGRATRLGLKERNNRPWTTSELEYLKTNYLRMKYAAMAKRVGRSVGTVHAKVRILGLRKLHVQKRWTLEEQRVVRRNYGKLSRSEIAGMLNVPVHVLENLASNMKLAGEASPKYTGSELQYIHDHYRTMSADEIAKKLGRSSRAIASLVSKRGWKGRKSLDTALSVRQQRVIRRYYQKKRVHEIARSLHLNPNTVRAYAKRVGLVRLAKPFTAKEHRYIEMHLGKIPIQAIARNLDRGIEAVRDYGHLQGWAFALKRFTHA